MGAGEGGFKPAVKEENGEISMTIEETNKLRESLGLKPLKVSPPRAPRSRPPAVLRPVGGTPRFPGPISHPSGVHISSARRREGDRGTGTEITG